MRPTDVCVLLVLAAAAASCGAELPPPPVVVALPPAVTVEPPPTPAPRLQVAASVAEEEPVSFHCAGGDLIVAGDRPYCVQKALRSFPEAERWCTDHGGHLARIGSEEESQALRAALGSPVGFTTNAWIGLAAGKARKWAWSTGAPVTFTSWAPGEPNNAGGHEDCGEMYPNIAQWNDAPCELPRPYFCESRPPRHGVAAPALKCGGVSFGAGAIDYCFERGQAATWVAAEASCKRAGGALASFRSPEELLAFQAAGAPRFGYDRIWIGFTDEGHQGRWTTIAGKKPAYTRWRPGEPNNAGGNEHCAEWFTSDGGWNDVPCDLPRVGICTPR